MLAPARITEDIHPLLMNRGGFFVYGVSWVKLHARRPWLSFEEFWSGSERVYDIWNADMKCFFAEFQRDLEKHAKILADRALRREIKQILNTDTPYSAPVGLLEPKSEPVDEEPSPPEFMYRLRSVVEEDSG